MIGRSSTNQQYIDYVYTWLCIHIDNVYTLIMYTHWLCIHMIMYTHWLYYNSRNQHWLVLNIWSCWRRKKNSFRIWKLCLLVKHHRTSDSLMPVSQMLSQFLIALEILKKNDTKTFYIPATEWWSTSLSSIV